MIEPLPGLIAIPTTTPAGSRPGTGAPSSATATGADFTNALADLLNLGGPPPAAANAQDNRQVAAASGKNSPPVPSILQLAIPAAAPDGDAFAVIPDVNHPAHPDAPDDPVEVAAEPALAWLIVPPPPPPPAAAPLPTWQPPLAGEPRQMRASSFAATPLVPAAQDSTVVQTPIVIPPLGVTKPGTPQRYRPVTAASIRALTATPAPAAVAPPSNTVTLVDDRAHILADRTPATVLLDGATAATPGAASASSRGPMASASNRQPVNEPALWLPDAPPVAVPFFPAAHLSTPIEPMTEESSSDDRTPVVIAEPGTPMVLVPPMIAAPLQIVSPLPAAVTDLARSARTDVEPPRPLPAPAPLLAGIADNPTLARPDPRSAIEAPEFGPAVRQNEADCSVAPPLAANAARPVVERTLPNAVASESGLMPAVAAPSNPSASGVAPVDQPEPSPHARRAAGSIDTPTDRATPPVALAAYGPAPRSAARPVRPERLNAPAALFRGLDEPVAAASPLSVAAPAISPPGTANAQQGIDLIRDSGLHRMIDRIETLRDAADARDTRIRLIPDALGPVEVSVRREGDAVSVHFTAAEAATRQLIADAQPRLTELAETRGVRIDRASVDGGAANGGGQPRPQAQPVTPNRAPAFAASQHESEPTDDRIA